MDDLTGAAWRKSTRSNNGGECVEVAPLADGRVAVRHSKRPDDETIVCTRTKWAAFVAGAKDGEFDF